MTLEKYRSEMPSAINAAFGVVDRDEVTSVQYQSNQTELLRVQRKELLTGVIKSKDQDHKSTSTLKRSKYTHICRAIYSLDGWLESHDICRTMRCSVERRYQLSGGPPAYHVTSRSTANSSRVTVAITTIVHSAFQRPDLVEQQTNLTLA
ncbi:hypothetical protein J6590_023996 [Homalodisca vitripennis]|nr:hypothetical protein J6590_023996 [Homalodisca vitripennis]